MPAHSNDTSAPRPFGELEHLRHHVAVGRVDARVSAPAVGALALRMSAGSTTMTSSTPAAFSAAAVTRPIGPAPNTRRGLARLRPGQPHRVVGHGERFHQRADVGAEVADRMDPLAFRDDVLREAAAESGQPDETECGADVVTSLSACVAAAADDVGLDHHPVPDREVGDAVAQLGDDAGELVPEGDRHGLPRQRVRGVRRRREDRALQVLVQVGPADAAPLTSTFTVPAAWPARRCRRYGCPWGRRNVLPS